MAIDIKLLMKFVKLAAGNTNENEANIAARRACKMLDEANKAGETVTIQSDVKRRPDVLTWQDVKRSADSFWRPSQKQQDWYESWDFDEATARAREARESQERTRQEESERRREEREKAYREAEEWARRYYEEADPFKVRYTYKSKPSEPAKKPRVCAKCGKSKMTYYIGNLFYCDECRYKDFTEKSP